MWYYVAVLVISAIVSYAAARSQSSSGMRPGAAEAPTNQEGKKIRKIYGTVWIEDPMVLGFKEMGTEKIKD